MSKIFTYSKDYKDGFKAAYILGPAGALTQIHKWRQEELEAKEQEPAPSEQT